MPAAKHNKQAEEEALVPEADEVGHWKEGNAEISNHRNHHRAREERL